MHWFLIAYTAAGLSVAVGPPKDEEFCSDMQVTETFHYKEVRPRGKGTRSSASGTSNVPRLPVK